MDTQELTIKNPNRSRKFGWNWTCTPTGRDAYSIETPSHPSVTGTIKQIGQEIDNDRTFRSIKSGGTFYNTAWFYDGKRIVATWEFGLLKQVDDLPLPETDEPTLYEMNDWNEKNRQHHWENDVWGYGWFAGFRLGEDTPLKIRVEAA
jgi:hypothetical protein